MTAAEENLGVESSAGEAEAPDEAGDPPKEESIPLDSPAEQPAGNEQAEAAVFWRHLTTAAKTITEL